MRRKTWFALRAELHRLAIVGCLAATFGASSAGAEPSERVIAKVNGAEIREDDLVFAEEDIGADLKLLDAQKKREEFVRYLQDVKLLSGFAQKEKFAESPEVKQELERQISFARSKAIMSAKLAEVGNSALNDVFLRTVYDDLRKSTNSELEVRVRDIEFRFTNRDSQEQVNAAKAKATAAAERARNGEDFESLSRELSEDPAGKESGGDLGYRSKAQLMFKGLAETAFKLEKGKVSEPFLTTFSWHVIKVEDVRPRQPPDFESIRKRLEQLAIYKAQSTFVEKLRANAKIERFDQPPAAAAQQKESKK
jgi:peptidyl-prolyl cis-trans isomerase C